MVLLIDKGILPLWGCWPPTMDNLLVGLYTDHLKMTLYHLFAILSTLLYAVHDGFHNV